MFWKSDASHVNLSYGETYIVATVVVKLRYQRSSDVDKTSNATYC